MNCLIVLGAGLGKRMGKERPKMLIPVLGRPILYWTLKNLEPCSAVESIILTVTKGYGPLFEKIVKRWRFHKVSDIIEGGKERQDSTRNALKALPSNCEWVGIHDGARPLVSPKHVKMCFDAAEKTGAAILAVPSKDTVKVAQKQFIKKTIPRDQCWAAQTPQVFRRDIAEKMHGLHHSKPNLKQIFTDDASIAESMGIRVQIVQGSYENIKVTTPEDLILMEAILKKQRVARGAHHG